MKRHEENTKAYSDVKKVSRKRPVYYDCNCVIFWKKENCGNGKNISVCQRLGSRKDE